MYYYLKKDALLNGEVQVIFYTENQIPNYKEISNFGELVEYYGENIPSDWVYDAENDVVFAESDRPSPYHVYIQGTWIIKDKEGYKKYCFEEIDKIKVEILEYGFDYLVDDVPHRQRCRDKDIALMGTSMVYLMGEQLIGNTTATTPWYFEDNYEWQVGLQKLVVFARYGKTFMESVYKAENYFKTLEEPKFITKFEFENKRKEIHRQLVGA